MRSCFDGEPETEDVGVCSAGTQTCGASGSWGPCLDQVLPGVEQCGDTSDDDCDGRVSCGESERVSVFGSGSHELAHDVAIDADGTRYVTGFYRESMSFGGLPLPSVNGTRDLFLLALDESGEHRFSLGIISDAHLNPAVVAAQDGAVICATVSSDIQLPDGSVLPSAGGSDMLVARFDARGELIWAPRLGGPATDQASAVAFAPDGSVVVTGWTQGAIELGTFSYEAPAEHYDVFVARISPNGTITDARAFTGSDDQVTRAITVAPGGEIYLGGYLEGSVDFGGGELSSLGDRYVFVVTLDADLNHLWTARFGDAELERLFTVNVDSAGDVVVTGRFVGSLPFGDPLVAPSGGSAGFVAKLSPDGEPRWSRALAGDASAALYGATITAADDIVVTGYYEGDATLADDDVSLSLPTAGILVPNIVVAKLNAAGRPLWARADRVQGEQDVGGAFRAWRKIASRGEALVLVGSFADTAWFQGVDGEEMIESMGGHDAFVAELSH